MDLVGLLVGFGGTFVSFIGDLILPIAYFRWLSGVGSSRVMVVLLVGNGGSFSGKWWFFWREMVVLLGGIWWF
jgi:hypothetical protein